jgi:alpha-L-fucosidase
MPVLTGNVEFFKGIGEIKFEGRESDNAFAFKWYDENKVVAGKTMKDQFRFACAYWHSFCNNGSDPFGEPTHLFPWDKKQDAVERAKDKMDAAFEFITKMNLPFYCFHDTDIVDYTNDINENEKRLQTLVEYAKQKQQQSGVKLLWGTANLFSNRRYMNGAATNPDFHVLSHAGAQVKAALDATIALEGENYVFWGGREGYMSLLNTNMKREQEHLARFFHMAKDYARKNGFKGTFFIEPKPCEPSKHQYDYDSARVLILHLLDKVSRGGNFLLDIGPDSDGKIPPIMQDRLLEIGRWMKINSEAIYGTSRWKTPFQWSEGKRDYKQKTDDWKTGGDMMLKLTVDPDPGYAVREVFFTHKNNTLYAILPRWPVSKKIILKGLKLSDQKVAFLETSESLKFKNLGNNVEIQLPEFVPGKIKSDHAFVIKIEGIQ